MPTRPGQMPRELEPFGPARHRWRLPAPRRTPPCTSDWPRSPLRSRRSSKRWCGCRSRAGSSSSGWSSSSCSRPRSRTTCRSARRSAPTTFSTPSSRRARRRCITATASRSSPTVRRSTRRCSRRSAAPRDSINMECYIFQPGQIADQFIEALSRARAQRRPRDACRRRDRQPQPAGAGRYARLRAAGCRIQSYQPAAVVFALPASTTARTASCSSSTEPTAFVGGAGVADWWAFPQGEALARAVARHDGAHRRPGRRRAAGRRRRELAGVLRRDPHRADYFPDLAPARRHDGVRGEELAVGSRDGLARDVSVADRGSRSDASASARRTSCRTGRCGARSSRWRGAASRITVIVPGRSTDQHWVRLASRRMWGELLDGGHPHLRVPAGDDPREGPDRRRAVVRARHDEHRQPIVRAQRRGEPRDARPGRRGAAVAGLRARPRGQRRDHARGVAAAGRCGRRSSDRSSGSWSGSSERADRAAHAAPSTSGSRPTTSTAAAAWTAASTPARIIEVLARDRRRRRRAAGSDRRGTRTAPDRRRKSAPASAWAG